MITGDCWTGLEVDPEEIAVRLRELHGVRRASLHVDLDGLDPAVARANRFAAPGGLGVEQLADAVRTVGEAHPVAALTLSAYDPSVDPGGSVVQPAVAVAGAVSSSPA